MVILVRFFFKEKWDSFKINDAILFHVWITVWNNLYHLKSIKCEKNVSIKISQMITLHWSTGGFMGGRVTWPSPPSFGFLIVHMDFKYWSTKWPNQQKKSYIKPANLYLTPHPPQKNQNAPIRPPSPLKIVHLLINSVYYEQMYFNYNNNIIFFCFLLITISIIVKIYKPKLSGGDRLFWLPVSLIINITCTRYRLLLSLHFLNNIKW